MAVPGIGDLDGSRGSVGDCGLDDDPLAEEGGRPGGAELENDVGHGWAPEQGRNDDQRNDERAAAHALTEGWGREEVARGHRHSPPAAAGTRHRSSGPGAYRTSSSRRIWGRGDGASPH